MGVGSPLCGSYGNDIPCISCPIVSSKFEVNWMFDGVDMTSQTYAHFCLEI